MPPSGQNCGFAVQATKKGELPLKVEKRAKGKKVTIIGNVSGDATKLARGLQTMLGVGGSVRQVDRNAWSVEVQGDQVPRVTKALMDFQCLRGLSSSALETARTESESRRSDSVLDRTAATKFLTHTQSGGSMSPEEERRRLLEMEAEFYGQFWESAQSSEDFLDVFEESRDLPGSGDAEAPPRPKDVPELNLALQALGLLAECGRAIRDFWQSSGMTLQQFRKIALNPGARLVGDGPGRKQTPTNLKSRQKVSDWRSGGSKVSYFSPTVSAIDNYERGKALGKTGPTPAPLTYPEEPALQVEEDEEGWCRALLSYSVPLPVPGSRLGGEEQDRVAKKALRTLQAPLEEDFAGVERSIPGVSCHLDCGAFGVDLSISERDFLQGQRREGGKAPTTQDKDEMRVEKKLREICALKRRQVDGETLDKLQAEKIAKRGSLFREVADLKLRRAEKELVKLFKSRKKAFQEAFWDLEFKALYAEDGPGKGESAPFGIFNAEKCEGPVSVSSDGVTAESAAPRWVGAPLHVYVKPGEVSAFAIEVVKGLVRLGWAAPDAAVAELGCSSGSFGFGGTGKKVSAGLFEPYGESFGAGDTIHCEAEREDGLLRIGFAKNAEPLGVAFEVKDTFGEESGLVGAVSSKGGFKVRIVSAESMPLEEAPEPILVDYVSYETARLAQVIRDFQAGNEENLLLWTGETVYVSANDGEGWLYGYFLDPEDPDDGGWFPADAVEFLDLPPAEREPLEAAQEEAGEEETAWDDWAPAAVPDIPNWAAETPQWPEESEAQPSDPAKEEEAVPGLAEWLQSIHLHHYGPKAAEWCAEMGAVSTEEIKECWEEFAQDLGLKPLEKKRLEKACR